jgi:hypothetical protein
MEARIRPRARPLGLPCAAALAVVAAVDELVRGYSPAVRGMVKLDILGRGVAAPTTVVAHFATWPPRAPVCRPPIANFPSSSTAHCEPNRPSSNAAKYARSSS